MQIMKIAPLKDKELDFSQGIGFPLYSLTTQPCVLPTTPCLPLHTPFLPQYLRLPAPHRFLATPLFLLPVPYLLLYYPPCFPYLLSNPPYSLAAPLLDKTQLKPQQLFLMFNMFSMSFSNHISLAVIRCDTW